MSGEIYSYLFPKLFKNGAKDVYISNILMKKNRPAHKLNVLCSRKDQEKIEKIIYKETTTLGIRQINIKRSCLERKYHKLKSSLGDVTIKAAYYNGDLIKFSPEYDECAEIAEEKDLALREVFAILNKEVSENLFI
jgi:hypothetical protein